MPQNSGPGTSRSARTWRDFVSRVGVVVLIVTLTGCLLVLLWVAYQIALLFLASVLLAIFLRTCADWVSRYTKLRPAWSIAVVITLILALGGLLGWLLAGSIAEQAAELQEKLPKALAHLQDQLEHYRWGQFLLSKVNQPGALVSRAGDFMSKISGFFSITIKTVVYVWVVLFCGLYLATQPEFYVDGFLRLIPKSKRARGRVVLRRIGLGLKHWLFGQIISMAIIGFLTWLGLFLLNIPLSAGLGVLAGVLDFVPVAGPWIAGTFPGCWPCW